MQALFENYCGRVECIRVDNAKIKNWTVYFIVFVLIIWEIMSMSGGIWFISQVKEQVFTGLEITIIMINIVNLGLVLISLFRYICCSRQTVNDKYCRIVNLVLIIIGLIIEGVTIGIASGNIGSYYASQYFIVDLAILAGGVTNAFLYTFLYYMLEENVSKNIT